MNDDSYCLSICVSVYMIDDCDFLRLCIELPTR